MNTLTNPTLKIFFQYAIPSVMGMLAVSSASVVDGYFVGNYVGASSLAAINLALPIFSILFGIALMLGVGSSVVCGKLLGAGDKVTASIMFSKTVIAVLLLSAAIIILLYFFLSSFLTGLGAQGNLFDEAYTYVLMFIPFIPFLMVGIVLDYIVKVDNQPTLAFLALLFSAVINIFLDWLLIVYFKQGILGAAIATGISQLALIFVLLPHFFSIKASIKFVKPNKNWRSVFKAAGNGVSEFINEASVGLSAMIFNFVMLKQFGVDGVAAYAVISYLLWFSIMVNYGISDALQPIISKNFGAKRIDRIENFLSYAFIAVLLIGVMIALTISQLSRFFAEFFLQSNDENTIKIVMDFALVIWPLFIFNGVSLVTSAYLTAVHQPIPSACIAIARSLLLPMCFVYWLPTYFGHFGIYMAIPVAEFVTLVIALILYSKFKPNKISRVKSDF